MHHIFVDKFSTLDSPVHRLDPRVKLVAVLSVIVLTVLTPLNAWPVYAIHLVAVLALLVFSGVPMGYILKYSSFVFPFALLIVALVPFMKGGTPWRSFAAGPFQIVVSYEGISAAASVLVKSFLSVLSILTLMSTTRFPDLLEAMEKLHVPRVMTVQLSFLYRYIFTLIDQAMRMRRARDLRAFRMRGRGHAVATGRIIGVLFLRTLDKAERIYVAMAVRGFDGTIRSIHQLQFAARDAVFVLLAVCIFALLIWFNLKIVY